MAPYLKPGDIVVRRAAKGHTDIVASISDEGVVYAYDCGSTPAVTKGAYPNGYPAGFFYADDRPGKIIRVP